MGCKYETMVGEIKSVACTRRRLRARSSNCHMKVRARHAVALWHKPGAGPRSQLLPFLPYASSVTGVGSIDVPPPLSTPLPASQHAHCLPRRARCGGVRLRRKSGVGAYIRSTLPMQESMIASSLDNQCAARTDHAFAIHAARGFLPSPSSSALFIKISSAQASPRPPNPRCIHAIAHCSIVCESRA